MDEEKEKKIRTKVQNSRVRVERFYDRKIKKYTQNEIK